MRFAEKILTLEQLPKWREAMRAAGKKLVVTNGCFDLLHRGHVTYLESARNLGDALLLGLNADASVRELKGAQRPLNGEDDRAMVIASLESVSGVCIFPERTAETFLSLAQPDIYAKGGDYTIDSLNLDERRMVERFGGEVVILPVVPGRSTTALLEKISRL
jgi:rfaE bifunctional protein nucleotidyltransferase chain/domain